MDASVWFCMQFAPDLQSITALYRVVAAGVQRIGHVRGFMGARLTQGGSSARVIALYPVVLLRSKLAQFTAVTADVLAGSN